MSIRAWSVLYWSVVCCLGLTASAPAEPAPNQPASSGDARKIDWVRPYAEAIKQAKASGRLVLAKPILGGTFTPKEGGTPAGGKEDCDGAW